MAHLPRGPPVHPAPLYHVQGYHGITYHLFIFNMMIYIDTFLHRSPAVHSYNTHLFISQHQHEKYIIYT